MVFCSRPPYIGKIVINSTTVFKQGQIYNSDLTFYPPLPNTVDSSELYCKFTQNGVSLIFLEPSAIKHKEEESKPVLPEPISHELQVEFNNLIKKYHITLQFNSGCGQRGHHSNLQAYLEIEKFVTSHPEFSDNKPFPPRN